MILITFSVFACSSGQDANQTVISGRLTVDPELDDTGNYSNFELLITFRNSEGTATDTVYYAITDHDGYFSGIAKFEERNLYPMVISRNNNQLAVVNLVLADGDSIRIDGEMPDLESSIEVESTENNIYETVDRIDRNFSRVMRFISSGAISEDSLDIELQKWSDIYWDIYNDNPETYAASRSLSRSIAILQGWNDSLMVERMNTAFEKDGELPATVRRAGMRYYANSEGADRAISFLEKLQEQEGDRDEVMSIQMDMIKLLYDSTRVDVATEKLASFEQTYSEHQSGMQWAERIKTDIEKFSAGNIMPGFEIVNTENNIVNNDSLSGKPYLLEITRLDNSLYQQQFDRLLVISQIYKPFGLEIVTIPVGASEVGLNAFLEERGQVWHFAKPGTFDAEKLLESLNVYNIPVRYLVNEEGELIRKYVGTEFEDIITGLQKIRTNQEEL